jgi:hypothetical protein
MVAAMRILPVFRVNILEFIRFLRFEYFDRTSTDPAIDVANYRWGKSCRGLFQLPVAA